MYMAGWTVIIEGLEWISGNLIVSEQEGSEGGWGARIRVDEGNSYLVDFDALDSIDGHLDVSELLPA